MPPGDGAPRLYLGLDSSTQSLTAVVVEDSAAGRRVVLQEALVFDEALPRYGTRHGVLPGDDPTVAVSSPLMWAEALDMMMARVARSGLDLGRLAAVSGSAQQHGSVCLDADAARGLSALDAARPLAGQLAPLLSRTVAPIWLDASTGAECREIARAVGGDEALCRHTGSRAVERFTGPQIRKFAADDPDAYAATGRVHLVSSFLASLLIGAHAPVDPGDGAGTNLMDLSTASWWPPAVTATAPGLAAKLPAIVPASTVIGRLSAYWRDRYGLPAASVVVWSGDNPSSLVGVGLVREGRLAVSLGTSDTIFGPMETPRTDPSGSAHVFGAPTGAFMGLTCFSNGSLARERIRDAHGLSWRGFSDALDATPPGNAGRMLLPWFVPEITPPVASPGARRYGGLRPDDAAANVRGVVEGQAMAMALHSRWMGVSTDTIHATGGAARNRQILQVVADVLGAEVRRFEVGNAAALGAALRALHAARLADGDRLPWDEVIAGLAEPASGAALVPDAARHSMYRGMLAVYEACEAHALGRGAAPPPGAFTAARPGSGPAPAGTRTR